MRKFIKRLKARTALNKNAMKVYTVLRILVILTAVRCFLTGNYESMMLCILSLILFLLPSFFEQLLKVEIPGVFQIIIYAFIYAAEILGEVNKYYTAIPGWDTMLHTLNGFLCAAIGMSLIAILNRSNPNLKLSPFYMAMAAFCFSMTVGVIWEFIEFTADSFFYLDMQKDFIVTAIGSVTLDETNSQIPVYVGNITRTVIETQDGTTYVVNGGYLDIGIIDTMKDLMVNFLGAVVFSTIGYFYEKKLLKDETLNEGEQKFAGGLLIKPLSDDEIELTNQLIDEEMSREGRKLALVRRKKDENGGAENIAPSEDA